MVDKEYFLLAVTLIKTDTDSDPDPDPHVFVYNLVGYISLKYHFFRFEFQEASPVA